GDRIIDRHFRRIGGINVQGEQAGHSNRQHEAEQGFQISQRRPHNSSFNSNRQGSDSCATPEMAAPEYGMGMRKSTAFSSVNNSCTAAKWPRKAADRLPQSQPAAGARGLLLKGS